MLSAGDTSLQSAALIKLIAELSEAGLVLTEAANTQLAKLSIHSLDVTAYFVKYFISQNILSAEFVIALIDKLSIKLLPAESCEMLLDKNTRYFNLGIRGVMISFQLRQSVFHHYWSGHADGHYQKTPLYLLKDSRDQKVAYKEAKYSRFFRGYACVVKDSEYFFASWADGKSLYSLENIIEDYSDHVRLIWLCSMLEKLTQLHQMWRVHLDLSSGNVIINTETNEAMFIDFEDAKKVRSLEKLHEDIIDFCTRILPVLFPHIDYYKDEEAELYINIPVYFGARQLYLRAINSDIVKPIFTAKQALEFCQWMLQEFDNLNTANIKQQADIMLATDAKIEASYLLLR